MASRCPPGVICIENITIIIVGFILVFTAFLVWRLTIDQPIQANQNKAQVPKENLVSIDIGQRQYPELRQTPLCAVSNVPGNVYLNPLAAPLRNSSAAPCPAIPINIRTQGVDSCYRQVGILTRVNGPEMILPLMGKPLIPARDKWNFYTMASNQAQVKLPIRVKKRDCTSEYGCDDLNTGDLVSVDGYDSHFRVRMYENDSPRYIPYI